MKNTQKLFLIVVCLVVALGFYGCRQFSRVARSIRQNQKAMLSQISWNPKPKENAKASLAASKETTETTATIKPQEPEKITSIELKISASETLESLDQRPLINVCRWIDGSSEFSKSLQESLSDRALFSSLYQSIIQAEGAFVPMFFQSRLPLSRAVILAVDQEPSLIRDVEFAISLYDAKKELEENLPVAKQIQAQTYYAWILAEVVFKNPSLMGDGNLMDLCERFQNFEEPLTSAEMSAEISEFMDRAQVKPEEIKFNANFEPQIEIRWGDQGFYYSNASPEFQTPK